MDQSHSFRDPAGERVLIVEDDTSALTGLIELLRSWGFEAEGASDGEEGLRKVTEFRPAIVISDLVMPRMDGLQLLHALQPDLGDLTFVLLTAQGTVDTAVEAMKAGAYDYLTKPVDFDRLRILLNHLVERQQTLQEVKALRRRLREHGTFGRLVGNSPAIRRIYRTIEQAAPTQASVLVWGESGTGKELVAQTLHELSPRSAYQFVAINCAAIPETLLESEIFGHEKGAFTGAIDRRLGCFELAHRGTLLLDEIAEMTPATQVKLLRVLQERTFRRLGGRQEQHVDVRVVAATNVNPLDAVERGKLREDLYYRLNVFSLEIPPLRERREDIPLLVHAFIQELNQRNARQVKSVTPEVLRLFDRYPWPGNIRELRNVMERATIVADGEFVTPEHLPPHVARAAEAAPARSAPVAAAAPAGAPTPATLASPVAPAVPAVTLAPGVTVEEAETRLIEITLQHTRNNKTRAAEILGISLKTLHNKLNRLKAMGTPIEPR